MSHQSTASLRSTSRTQVAPKEARPLLLHFSTRPSLLTPSSTSIRQRSRDVALNLILGAISVYQSSISSSTSAPHLLLNTSSAGSTAAVHPFSNQSPPPLAFTTLSPIITTFGFPQLWLGHCGSSAAIHPLSSHISRHTLQPLTSALRRALLLQSTPFRALSTVTPFNLWPLGLQVAPAVLPQSTPFDRRPLRPSALDLDNQSTAKDAASK